MSWDIVYTAGARRDLRDIYEYIAYELLVPETAAGQTQRIMKEIRALDEMPMQFRLYEEEPWHSEGLRFFPIDNYLVFYLPDETKNTVNIVRIMYGGRDIRRQLSETEMEYCTGGHLPEMAGAFLMPRERYNLTKQGVGRQRASLRRRLLAVRFWKGEWFLWDYSAVCSGQGMLPRTGRREAPTAFSLGTAHLGKG